jgi:hypothetical protein
MDENRNALGYWWEARRKEHLGRPRRRWVDNIKTDLKI